MLKIHSVETFGTHEGPGIRLVIFLQGCNFNCAYCHNPDTISVNGGKTISRKEIINLLEDERPYFAKGGGLTVSGGEPGLQAKELIKLFNVAKKQGFHTALDTNGSLNNEDYYKLLSIADLVLFDLKHFDDLSHRDLTGQSNQKVLQSITYRNSLGKPFWVRYVLVPGLTDDKNIIDSMGKYLSKLKNLERLEILPYHNFGVHKYKDLGLKYRLDGVKRPSQEEIIKVKNILSKYLKAVVVRN